jgi:hypothetical protein
MVGVHSPRAAAASVHVCERGASCPAALRASLVSFFSTTGFAVHNPRAATASVHAPGRDCSRCSAALPALTGWGRAIAAGFAGAAEGGAGGRGGSCPAALRASLVSFFTTTGFPVHNPSAATASVHASWRSCSRSPALPALTGWGGAIAAGFARAADGGAGGLVSPAAASAGFVSPAGASRAVTPGSAMLGGRYRSQGRRSPRETLRRRSLAKTGEARTCARPTGRGTSNKRSPLLGLSSRNAGTTQGALEGATLRRRHCRTSSPPGCGARNICIV